MTIADTTRSTARSTEHPPSIRLCWRACGVRSGEANASGGEIRLQVEIESCEEIDTGILRAWIERDGREEELLPPTHVDIARVLAHGWTHIEIQSADAPTVSMSLHEGVLRYVRSDFPALAGLPGGTYEPPTLERHVDESFDEVD